MSMKHPNPSVWRNKKHRPKKKKNQLQNSIFFVFFVFDFDNMQNSILKKVMLWWKNWSCFHCRFFVILWNYFLSFALRPHTHTHTHTLSLSLSFAFSKDGSAAWGDGLVVWKIGQDGAQIEDKPRTRKRWRIGWDGSWRQRREKKKKWEG